MAVLATGNTFVTGDQVTATTLNAAVNSATFAAGAVDGSTTQLSGGAIIVKDGGITSAKLDTNIAVSGTLDVTGITTLASTNSNPLRLTGGTTSAHAIIVTNTGGTAVLGMENSAGGNQIVGSTAYDTIIRGPSGLAFSADAGTTLHGRISNTGTLAISGGAWFGTAALATNATTGHVYIPTCAGTPTGVPASKTGQVAIQYDTTNDFLYIYNGGWKKSTVYA